MTTLFSGLTLVALTGVLAAQAPAITRTQLQRVDLTHQGYEAITAKADFPMNGTTGKHTHPGDEVSYVLEGMVTLEVEGMAPRMLKAGDTFFNPAGKAHNVVANGGKAVVIANYLVEKGKPLTTAVQ